MSRRLALRTDILRHPELRRFSIAERGVLFSLLLAAGDQRESRDQPLFLDLGPCDTEGEFGSALARLLGLDPRQGPSLLKTLVRLEEAGFVLRSLEPPPGAPRGVPAGSPRFLLFPAADRLVSPSRRRPGGGFEPGLPRLPDRAEVPRPLGGSLGGGVYLTRNGLNRKPRQRLDPSRSPRRNGPASPSLWVPGGYYQFVRCEEEMERLASAPGATSAEKLLALFRQEPLVGRLLEGCEEEEKRLREWIEGELAAGSEALELRPEPLDLLEAFTRGVDETVEDLRAGRLVLHPLRVALHKARKHLRSLLLQKRDFLDRLVPLGGEERRHGRRRALSPVGRRRRGPRSAGTSS